MKASTAASAVVVYVIICTGFVHKHGSRNSSKDKLLYAQQMTWDILPTGQASKRRRFMCMIDHSTERLQSSVNPDIWLIVHPKTLISWVIINFTALLKTAKCMADHTSWVIASTPCLAALSDSCPKKSALPCASCRVAAASFSALANAAAASFCAFDLSCSALLDASLAPRICSVCCFAYKD